MPANPYYFIQINHTGSERLARILRIPASTMTVRDALKRYGPEWDNMLSFTLIRNPYARAVSLYSFYYYGNKHGILEHGISFLNFLNLTLKHQKKPYYDKPRFFQSQWEWIRDFDNEQGVVCLAEFEKYFTSVYTLLQMIGLDPNGINIRPEKEVNPYKWEKFYEGTEGRMAKRLVREVWADDFHRLKCYNE